LEWRVEGALGGHQLEWMAEKQAVLSLLRYCYSFLCFLQIVETVRIVYLQFL